MEGGRRRVGRGRGMQGDMRMVFWLLGSWGKAGKR